MDDDVFGLQPHRLAGADAEDGVDERGRDVHLRDAVAELVGPRLLHFDGPLTDDCPGVPARARRLHLLEDAREQLRLEEAVRLGRHLEPAALGLLQPLLLGGLAEVLLDLLLEFAELLHVARLDELRELVHVDDADLRGLRGLLELLQQLVESLQLFLDLEGFGDGHRLVAGELVLAGEFIDLVLVPEALDEAQQAARELAALVAGAIPQALEVVELLVADGFVEVLAQLGRRLHLLRLILIRPARRALDRVGLVSLEDAALALLEDLAQRLDARAEAANLRRVDVDGVGEFLRREAAHVAVGHEVVERRRDEVRRRRGGAGKFGGVVLLVGMDDAAKAVARTHG